MMESGWARAGLEDSADEIQFRERAREALGRYHDAEASTDTEVEQLLEALAAL